MLNQEAWKKHGFFNTMVLIKSCEITKNCGVWGQESISSISQFSLAGTHETVLPEYKCKGSNFASVLDRTFFVHLFQWTKQTHTHYWTARWHFSHFALLKASTTDLAQSLNYRSDSNYFQKLDSLFCTLIFFPLINFSLSNETKTYHLLPVSKHC